MRLLAGRFVFAACLMLSVPLAAAETVAVAAASNLQLALREIVTQFSKHEPQIDVQLSFGSSGKLSTQIRQGAPFDLFLSADLSFAQALADEGLALGPVTPYGAGRLALWSATLDASQLTLRDLADARYTRIAIANPRHAPYGQRAQEALQAQGVWDAVKDKLVFGENISQTAQFVRSGNAQVGLISLSLALDPALRAMGGYALVPGELHQALTQGRVLLRRAEGRAAVARFVAFLDGEQAAAVLQESGYAAAARR